MPEVWKRWRQWLRPARQEEPAPGTAAPSSQGVIEIEGQHFVFGMDWRMLPPTRRLARALAMARQERMRCYALSEMEDIVGYLAHSLPLRRPHYAAPLQLAARFSQGGLELFVFALARQRHAVIALQDSRPLPGYDALVDAQQARTMVQEFLAIQRGQPMRLAGNTSWLEGQEWVEPEDLFADPVRSARVYSLRSSRSRLLGLLALLAGLAGLAVVAAGVWGFERWRALARAELQRSPAHQQKVYAEGLAQAWAALPPEAHAVLWRWQLIWQTLPQVHQGWALQRVQCELQRCRAEWKSLFGSQADFLQALPPGARLELSDAGDMVAVRTLATEHDLSQLQPAPLLREDLPGRSEARRVLGDWLLDLKLLGHSVPRIEAPRLLGGQQDPELLVDPVFVGQWSLQHGLWLLPALTLPAFVRVQSLTLVLAGASRPANDAAAAEGQDGAAPQWSEPHFILNGTYYARR